MSVDDAVESEESLQQRVAELERENRDLNARLDAMGTRFDRMVRFLIGEQADFGENRFETAPPLWEQLGGVEERLDEVDSSVETAIGLATVDSKSGSGEKIGIARDIAKNFLVKTAALKDDPYNNPKISNPKVQEMAEPEEELKWQTVDDAWKDLAHQWDCFAIKSTDKGKRLELVETPSKPLIRAVERNLGRDDLAKRLVGRDSAQGGSLNT